MIINNPDDCDNPGPIVTGGRDRVNEPLILECFRAAGQKSTDGDVPVKTSVDL